VDLDLRTQLTLAEVAEVKALVHEVKAHDGVPPLSDSVLLALGDEGQHLLAHRGDELVGYAHLEDGAAEVAVLPSYRRKGLGRALVSELIALTPGAVRIWARGENPGAVRLAASLGFRSTRVLRQMRRPLTDLPAYVLPVGVELRTFVVGQDEEALISLNNKAFRTHPEQGRWTVDDVVAREQEPWFDAAGVFLAHRGPKLVGFHWTKVEGGLGEVYVVGVDPSQQGTGLGKALTLIGLHHLAGLGLPEVLLYVDETNHAAIALYERLGFRTKHKDVSWSR
jgi:mycothiol synthase